MAMEVLHYKHAR